MLPRVNNRSINLSPQALYNLGVKYATGEGVEKDDKAAFEYYKLAADQGLKEAQFCLAFKYARGKGVKKDDEAAAKYYKLAADQGHLDAQYNLAYRYVNGNGVKKDDEAAAKYYKLAADQGHLDAQYNLAYRYVNGNGVKKDDAAAARYFKLAADQGRIDAQYKLAIMYDKGKGIEKDGMAATHYYKLAADQGHKEAQFDLAYRYNNGQGIKKDDKAAIHYFKLAADQGLNEARYNLAVMYSKGEGVEKDDKVATLYYTLVTDRGDKEAQYYLGFRYMKGLGVPKNYREAARYFQLAADQGHTRAQFYVGMCYQNGTGIETDDELAVHYIKLAADQGLSLAQHNLAIRYSKGRGVPQDLEKAKQLIYWATTVEKEDSFRQFISNKNIDKTIMGAPALLLKIFEKKSGNNIIKKGLYEYLFSPNVNALKSYVPWNPPTAKNQRGPTCGIQSLEIALTFGNPNCPVPPARKHEIKPTDAEKKEPPIPSLRSVAKKYGSVDGAVYDINCLEKTAKEFDFKTTVIKSDKENYIQSLLNTIHSNNSVILPVDIDDAGFPSNEQGEGTHYALAWGYIYMDNQYHFLVTQWGKHYLWSADALLKSHEQIPVINPLKEEYYKDRQNDFYYPIAKDQCVSKNDLRSAPLSSLENFKFTALAIPSVEKNCLSLNDKLDEKQIDEAAKSATISSDALMLKLLAEARAKSKKPFKNSKILAEIAEKNHDYFSGEILKNASYLNQEKIIEDADQDVDFISCKKLHVWKPYNSRLI